MADPAGFDEGLIGGHRVNLFVSRLSCFMGVDFYLLPKAPVNGGPTKARDWLDREHRRFAEIPIAFDPAAEARKRKLADLLLKMKPDFEEFGIRHEEIAEFEKISLDEARRKYRYIEINGPGVQFTVFDHYIALGVYSKIDSEQLDAVLAALSAEGGFVLFDPQSDAVTDLSEESFA